MFLSDELEDLTKLITKSPLSQKAQNYKSATEKAQMVELERVKSAENAACNDPSQRSIRTGDTCVVYSSYIAVQ